MNWRVDYRRFRKSRDKKDDAFEEAAAFASQFSTEQVISITTAREGNDIIAVVWHWISGPFWKCPHCGEAVEEQFAMCWNCSTPMPENPKQESQVEVQTETANEELTSFACQSAQGSWANWDDFFADLAKMATSIGPERLVSISHSGTEDDALGAVFHLCEKKPNGEELADF